MKKNWLDHLADVISGRLYNSVVQTYNFFLGLKSRQDKLEETLNTMSQQEDRLRNAAQTLMALATAFTAFITNTRTELATLKEQAASNQAFQPSSALDDELDQLEGAIAPLEDLARQLNPDDAQTVGNQRDPSAPGSGTAPLVQTPVVANPALVDTSVPTTSPVVMQDPIPLAGETGIANTPTNAAGEEVQLNEGEVFAAQPQPGSSVSASSEGAIPAESAEAPQNAVDQEAAVEMAAEIGQGQGQVESGTEGNTAPLVTNEAASGQGAPNETADQGQLESGSAQAGGPSVLDETITSNAEGQAGDLGDRQV